MEGTLIMNKIEWYEQTAEIIQDRLLEFYEHFYSEYAIEKIGGDKIRIQPCPKCGHSDCCTVGVALHCFSGNCNWSGTHINAWFDFALNRRSITQAEAVRELDRFTGLNYPLTDTESEYFKKHRIQQQILAEAEKVYHRQLMKSSKEYPFKDKTITPLDYMLTIRKRNLETIKGYSMGFCEDYLELHGHLLSMGFTKEDIKETKVWIPEGVFVFFYRHPITKDIVRLNIKNPFCIKRKDKDEHGNEIEGGIIQGFSSRGNKFLYFSNGFSFKKPFDIVEGEHDMYAILENGGSNVCCMGGNPSDEELKILTRAQSTIYIATDNDEAGGKYVERLNSLFPDKDLRRVSWKDKYNDIDDYYREGGRETKTWEELEASAEVLFTEETRTWHMGNLWVIANRFRRLEFTIGHKDSKGNLVGKVDYYLDGKIDDRASDTTLMKCKAKMKPLSFYLSDAIEEYFNTDLDKKDTDELINIYWYSSYKASIIKLLAQKVYECNSDDDLINKLKVRLRTPEGKDDVFDAILKEVNDIQNQSVRMSFCDIPKMKISHYFNVKNNDAYFYFINMKIDGDASRKLPYLLRNDRQLIRLDLLKRKDSQCLLLVDNKYELPFEVNEAVLDVRECSLNQKWVEKYVSGEIHKEELVPGRLVRDIEGYIKRFYYSNDDTTYKILALYIYTTYFYELFGQMPYLFINGEKGSGKSILDEVLHLFAFNAKMAIDISEAALFRTVSIEGGTIILDEMENLTSKNRTADSTMASILKGGYARSGSIYRFNNEKNITEAFDAYSPKIISNIMGVEDVIGDRCIPISTYRLDVTPETKKEDPKYYLAERLDEIREVTSKCCISALESFSKLKNIYDTSLFTTGNARLSQILTPVLAIAKLVDIPEKETLVQRYPDQSVNDIKGEYESALMHFYNTTIKAAKKDIDEGTPEGIIKRVVPIIAKELWGEVPQKDMEYTITENHKYQESIKYSKEEGWFEVNVIHFKCFLEEHLPGETAYTRIVPRWIKTCFKFQESDVKRRTAKIENEDLVKEFKGNTKPKVNAYRFYFRDFVDNDFLTSKPTDVAKPKTDIGETLF